MPLQRAVKDGKPGWKYGKSGRVYTYSQGDPQGEKRAKRLAIKQGLAIQHESGEKVDS